MEQKTSTRWVLAALALCVLLPSLGTSILNVALPTLADALGASFQQVQWLVLAYLLATTALIVVVGRLGDMMGRRRLLMGGILLFTAACGAGGMASGLGPLIAARTAQGLGAALMLSLALAFVGEAVPKANTGAAMGLLGSMSAAGTALGPSLGGVLLGVFGWRVVFFVNVPLGILALLLARHLPADRPASKANPAGSDIVPLLIRLTRFRDPRLSGGLAMSAIVSTVVMATLVVGPFYLTRTLGLDATLVGIVMSVGPVIAALTGLPAGRIVDRAGASRATVAGLAGMIVGCAALSLAPVSLGIAGYVVPIAILTASYALFQAANNTAVMMDVPSDQRGVISGMLNLSRNLGLISGASVMGAVFVALGLRGTFVVAAVLVAGALVIAARAHLREAGTPARPPVSGEGPRLVALRGSHQVLRPGR